MDDPEATHPTIPAATVVPLRDGPDGLETLLVQRSAALSFAGGMWVWPGGRIDAVDWSPDRPDDLEAAARRAAVREAREEAGLEVDHASLVWFAHWTPPPVLVKRYATFFFATADREGEVVVDGSEVLDHRWVRPVDALALRNALEIELAPPTWVTLEHLSAHRTVEEALASMAGRPPERFQTEFTTVGEVGVAIYHGDAAYGGGDPAGPGPRHRLWMGPDGWRYERHP